MDWFKTTASFWSHPKVVDLRDGQFRVLVSGWGYAAQHNTGGRITPAALRMIGGKPADAKALVEAGLWHVEPEGGWRIHDWDDHQEAAVAWHRKRERDREAARERRRQTPEERRANVARQSEDDPPTESHDSRALEKRREEKRRGEPPSPLGQEGTRRATSNGRPRNMTPDEVEAAAERIEAEMRERNARESRQ